MARFRLTLCCRPEPIARVMRVFPKLALLFIIIHVAGMIYTVTRPYPVKTKDQTTAAVDMTPTRSLLLNANPASIDKKNETLHSKTRNETESRLLNKLRGRLNFERENVRVV